jgi:hypothetical protein
MLTRLLINLWGQGGSHKDSSQKRTLEAEDWKESFREHRMQFNHLDMKLIEFLQSTNSNSQLLLTVVVLVLGITNIAKVLQAALLP